MNSYRFSLLVLLWAAVITVMGFSLNYLVDPYSVFSTKLFPEFGQLQERYIKIEYLKGNPNFNTILLGSSRIGVIRTEDVDISINEARSYNLTVSQANQWDEEKLIEWLTKNISRLRQVIVQVDWPVNYGPIKPGYALLTAMHPEISGHSQYEFLLDYLTYFNFEAMKAKVRNNLGGLDQLRYDISKGYWSRPLRDIKISEDCKGYITAEGSFKTLGNQPVKIPQSVLAYNLESIARYKALLDKLNVKLTVILTPMNHNYLSTIDINDYSLFVKQLANITDFYNFMYFNNITNNDCNYYEVSHYRANVGSLVIKAIATNENDAWGGGLQYVTKSNVDFHIEFLKSNFLTEDGRIAMPP